MTITKQYSTSNSLPNTLTAQHIAVYLIISHRRMYKPFQLKTEYGRNPNFNIGVTWLI